MHPNFPSNHPQPLPFQQNTNHNRMQPPQQGYPSNFIPGSHPIQSSSENNRFAPTMYKSTIQPTTSSNSNNNNGKFGFGKLESMGRFIQEAPEPNKMMQQSPKVSGSTSNNVFNFRTDRREGPRMAASVIFKRQTQDKLNRFPSFRPNEPSGGFSKLQALMNRNKFVELKEDENNQTPEEKRKKQISSIKHELQLLNQKMENRGFRKVDGITQGGNKPYFQLPTRKTGATSVSGGSVSQNSSQTSFTQNTQTLYQSNFQQNQKETGNHQQVASNQINDFNSTSVAPLFGKPATEPVSSVSTSGSSWVSPSQLPKPSEGMFKKKNPYLSDEFTKVADCKPKTIPMLPKTTNPTTVLNPKNQTKAVQLPEQPVPHKQSKVMQAYQQVQHRDWPKSCPKQFKKSDFALGKKLGKGQYGQVMLARHRQTGFLMGLKVMSKKQIREEKYQNQIARQLSINFYLSHRNIAPLYGYFTDEQNLYLLVEYCTDGQLLSLLRKNHRMEDPEVSPIIRQICEGLDYIHREGIIHRDIKPENILFNFNTVKICDFGWAVHSGNGMRRTVSGSPLYYSPEIVMETEYDQKIDIWSIGMMTYECLLGKIPFRIYSQLDLNRIVQDEIKFPEYVDVTDEAKDFILRIMKKKPEERMQIKQIMRHPFITKYLKTNKLSADTTEELRRLLS